MAELKEFIIKGLILDPVNNSPIVILQDKDETVVLPIWVGIFEANAIALEMEHIETPRPMTHDLIRSLLSALSTEVQKIVVCDLRENTYYAEIYIRSGNKTVVVDSRPSDALAVALRTGARIFVVDEVIQKSRLYSITDQREWSEEELKKWLENLTPEDMGKYEM
ncbi:MAG: bifunctional nuclease family protein [Acidobacteria bacterium]|nr:bifunctional nuclease family protein [Acidobacteriota bacterium]